MAIGPFDEELVRQGTIFGALTFVAGILLVVPLLFASGGALGAQTRAMPVAMAAFGYMVLHAWPVLFGLPANVLLLSIAPAGLLTAVGYVVARRTAARPTAGRYRGASVTFGYFLLTVVGFLYVLVRPQLAATGGIASAFTALNPAFVVAAVGYTGLLFPILFGGLGGYIAERRE